MAMRLLSIFVVAGDDVFGLASGSVLCWTETRQVANGTSSATSVGRGGRSVLRLPIPPYPAQIARLCNENPSRRLWSLKSSWDACYRTTIDIVEHALCT